MRHSSLLSDAPVSCAPQQKLLAHLTRPRPQNSPQGHRSRGAAGAGEPAHLLRVCAPPSRQPDAATAAGRVRARCAARDSKQPSLGSALAGLSACAGLLLCSCSCAWPQPPLIVPADAACRHQLSVRTRQEKLGRGPAGLGPAVRHARLHGEHGGANNVHARQQCSAQK